MIKSIQAIRPPFSSEERRDMDNVLEQLIEYIVKHTNNKESVAIKHFADDLTDMLVDIKVDLNNFDIKERANG